MSDIKVRGWGDPSPTRLRRSARDDMQERGFALDDMQGHRPMFGRDEREALETQRRATAYGRARGLS